MKKETTHLLKLLPEFKANIGALKYIYSHKGDLHLSNLQGFLILKNTETPENKTIDISLFKKTKSISQSIVDHGYTFEEFPKFEWAIDRKELENLDFLNVANNVKQYSSNDYTTRLSLTGVNVSYADKEICATDGHRAGIEKFIASDSLPDNLSFILPIPAIKSLVYITNNFDVKVFISGDYITAFGEEISFAYKLVEGPYPQYQKIIPKEFKTNISVSKDQTKELLAGLKVLLPHVMPKTRQIYLRGHQIGTGTQNPKHVNLSFDFADDLGMNCSYLMEMIKGLGSFTFKMNSPLSATSLQKGSNIRILMPLRTLEEEKENFSLGEEIKFEVKKTKNKALTPNKILETIKKNQNLTGTEILKILEIKENK